jgi:hypothetical protein
MIAAIPPVVDVAGALDVAGDAPSGAVARHAHPTLSANHDHRVEPEADRATQVRSGWTVPTSRSAS